MIKEIKEQKPFIHFGFNKQSVTANLGNEIIVYQDKIVTDNTISINENPNFTIEKINNNQFKIIPTELGNANILCDYGIIEKDKINSNLILINVEEITLIANYIFLNNELITLDTI
jgi:hypothetical protein